MTLNIHFYIPTWDFFHPNQCAVSDEFGEVSTIEKRYAGKLLQKVSADS
jgi:hypothetical protein